VPVQAVRGIPAKPSKARASRLPGIKHENVLLFEAHVAEVLVEIAVVHDKVPVHVHEHGCRSIPHRVRRPGRS
jgi:hypothetical protein